MPLARSSRMKRLTAIVPQPRSTQEKAGPRRPGKMRHLPQRRTAQLPRQTTRPQYLRRERLRTRMVCQVSGSNANSVSQPAGRRLAPPAVAPQRQPRDGTESGKGEGDADGARNNEREDCGRTGNFSPMERDDDHVDDDHRARCDQQAGRKPRKRLQRPPHSQAKAQCPAPSLPNSWSRILPSMRASSGEP